MWAAGDRVVCGIDEVGRGAWAGPVTVAAVVPQSDHLRGIRDSKMLDRSERARAAAKVREWAVAVGVGQLVAAIFPGTSRSGATILFALMLGLSRPAATEFSFLVSIPTMLAVGGVKTWKALQEGAPAENWSLVLLGVVVSMGVSFAAVKWFLRFVQSHTFNGFGWYRIVLGIVLLVVLL